MLCCRADEKAKKQAAKAAKEAAVKKEKDGFKVTVGPKVLLAAAEPK